MMPSTSSKAPKIAYLHMSIHICSFPVFLSNIFVSLSYIYSIIPLALTSKNVLTPSNK
jgi:hypothetical protein